MMGIGINLWTAARGTVFSPLSLFANGEKGAAAWVLSGSGALAALIVAQQRAGSARPYTVRANRETLK